MIRLDTRRVSGVLLEMRPAERLMPIAARHAAQMEARAKRAAPFCDRTGRARAAILGSTEQSGDRVRISLSADAPYSAALEMGYGGRYAALMPAIRAGTDAFLKEIRIGGRR